jgi:putative transcriptional regulator
VPPEIDVKAIRTKLSMSQKDFAAEFGFTYDQVKAWEQKRFRPQGGAGAYLLIIERDPNAVLAVLRQVARAARREQR